MPELERDLGIEPVLLRLGMQPQLSAEEADDLGYGGAALLELHQREVARHFRDAFDLRTEAFVPAKKGLCQLLRHRLNLFSPLAARHPWPPVFELRVFRTQYLTEGPIGAAPDVARGDRDDDDHMGLTVGISRLRAYDERPHGAIVAIVGGPQQTNLGLAAAWLERGIPAALFSAEDAVDLLAPLDTALLRLDVLPTLDGIEDGLDEIAGLTDRGVRVLNPPQSMLSTHDKLRTARDLVAARLPHPKTVHLPRADAPLGMRPPLVLKPRFGSWGEDVFLCENDLELSRVLDAVGSRRWFRRHGAILQEVAPSSGRDIRILVAHGRVVGAIQRVAPPGEWRTNVARGATRLPVTPTFEMSQLAIAAAAAVGADFVGVDLLPVPGGQVVIELNGAVEFDSVYDLAGADVYSEIADALGIERATVAVS